MDWIHCNHCFNMPKSENGKNVSWFMTNCGHIFCGRCTDGSSQKCLVENNNCIYSLLSDIQRDRGDFFLPLSEIIGKVVTTVEFQCSQYASLLFYLVSKLERYMAQKEEISKLRSECKRHRDEKNALKNVLVKRMEEIRDLKKKMEVQKRPQNFQLNMHPAEKRVANQGSSHGSGFLFGAAAAANGQFSFSPLTQSSKNSQLFTLPNSVQFPKNYRESIICNSANTPQRNTPLISSPSSESTLRPGSRRVMLPGDKGSPINRLRLQNLHLQCTPRVERAGCVLTSAGHAPRIGLGNASQNKYF